MKKLIKTLIKEMVSIFKTAYYLIRGTLHFVNDVISGRHMKLPDNNKQDTVLILGNGPSLNDLELLDYIKRDFKIATVNFFPAKYDLFFLIKPEFLCLFDPGFFDIKVKSAEQDIIRLKNALEKVNWNLTIIAPAGKTMDIKNSFIKYAWVNQFIADENKSNSVLFWLYKHNISNFGYQNVVLGAIYYFLTCRYKRIYIGGVDMSEFKDIFVDENNRVFIDSAHAYGNVKSYVDEISEYGVLTISQNLYAYNKMFFQFDISKKYADYLEIPITNLSINSYIDCFDKLSPKDFYRMKNYELTKA